MEPTKFDALVDLALRMARKGRPPKNIYTVLQSKGANKEEVKEILDIVYHSEPKTTKTNWSLKKILFEQNLAFDIQTVNIMLKRLSGLTLIAGLIMYVTASEEINHNTIYSYICLLSSTPLIFCWLLLKKGFSPKVNFYIILMTFAFFTGIHLLEYLVLGKPNFYLVDYKYARNYGWISSRTGVAGIIALIMPYLYIIYNVFVVASLSFPVYTYYKRCRSMK